MNSDFTLRRRFFRLLPLAVFAPLIEAQSVHTGHSPDDLPVPGVPDDAITLPNGKLQRDEILRLDYNRNLRDARDLIDLARSFRQELGKSEQSVLSLALLKKLDDMDKITKRIRNRMRH